MVGERRGDAKLSQVGLQSASGTPNASSRMLKSRAGHVLRAGAHQSPETPGRFKPGQLLVLDHRKREQGRPPNISEVLQFHIHHSRPVVFGELRGRLGGVIKYRKGDVQHRCFVEMAADLVVHGSGFGAEAFGGSPVCEVACNAR